MWLGYWKSSASKRFLVLVSCYPEAVTLEKRTKREKKRKKSARESAREKPTPSRTRSSRNRAEFGRNERSRGEVYRPTFRFFSLSLRAPSRFFFSLMRANAREKSPFRFSLSPTKTERKFRQPRENTRTQKNNKKISIQNGCIARTSIARENSVIEGERCVPWSQKKSIT